MADKNISLTPQEAVGGLDLNTNVTKVGQGKLTYALNAVVDGIDGKGISYTNEPGNTLYVGFPEGMEVIGKKAIIEKDLILLFFAGEKGASEIGQVKDGTYTKLINSSCLNFSRDFPIHKVFYRIIHCGTEVYWTDGNNPRRYINLDDLPFKKIPDPNGCELTTTDEVDCNRLLVQPNFSIPEIDVEEVVGDGNLTAGTLQFAIQYANSDGEGYTSYFSITNPLPIHDGTKVTLDFNYPVNKSVKVRISGIETGLYEYINLAVIKTVNNITSFELAGRYLIEGNEKTIVYSGQKLEDLTENDIFEKFAIYEKANDLYSVQGVLGWADLTEQERVSYQKIANKITLEWQTWRLKKDAYSDPLHVANHKGYMRDEVYPFELVPLFKNGKQLDGFHIPGRLPHPDELEYLYNDDTVIDDEACAGDLPGLPKWKVYNTATKTYYAQATEDPCYEGPWENGEMGYWESEDTYPCKEEIWGELAGRPIRHHKMPDSVTTPIYENGGEYIYPLGVKINVQQVLDLIRDSDLPKEHKEQIAGFKIVRGNRAGGHKSVVAKGILHNVGKATRESTSYFFPNYPYNSVEYDPYIGSFQTSNDTNEDEERRAKLRGFLDESKQRFTFHSPDTHFYQPTLGNTLKLETVEYGMSKGHFQQVKEHAKYRFLSSGAYGISLGIAALVAALGTGVDGISVEGGILALQTCIDILERVTPKINFCWQHNSVGEYKNYDIIPNDGNKQRRLDISQYVIAGMQSVSDVLTLNNFDRESSVYLKTNKPLPFTHETGAPPDRSRYVIPVCDQPGKIVETTISSYYGSLKRNIPNQWGQVYSYETIDTGFQWTGDLYENLQSPYSTVFGGDCFIGRFAYKSKMPFFIDNRVKFPDDADVDYRDLGNVGYPIYWFSTNSEKQDNMGDSILKMMGRIFGVKQNNLHCDEDKVLYQKGKIYLFAYGIPYFFCESEVNIEMRQAFNGAEGDFYPHVSTSIPDDWLQEVTCSIKQDNTYHYNKSYSKQNKENYFSHYPDDWDNCKTKNEFLTIYSDPNNWLVYRPVSRFEFPQTNGRITSIDAIDNGAILVRFEKKSMVYNALLTVSTSNPQAAYLGNSTLFKSSPPLEFTQADSGYTGSQHKMFIRTPSGDVYVDALRGQVFLVQGTKPQEISTPEVAKFLGQHLAVEGDNHFAGKGVTGVYDPLFDRVLITKIDGDKSFTLSFSFQTKSWISLHSYIPTFYVEHPTLFYSSDGKGLWLHGNDITSYNQFYGEDAEYVIEYPFIYKMKDEILQAIHDNSLVLQYFEDGSYIETDDYFTSAILSNNNQSSGVLELFPKPKNSLKEYMSFPKYGTDRKGIIVAKSDNLYQFNTFWALNKPGQPIWKPSKTNLSIFKDLNQTAMDYGKRSRQKAPLRAKDLRVRLISTHTDRRLISNFILTQTQTSYK